MGTTTSLLDREVYDETADCQSTGSIKKRRRKDGMVWDLLNADTLRAKEKKKEEKRRRREGEKREKSG